MPNLTNFVLDKAFQCLVYAKPKKGKTFGALTFPRPNVIDFDNGIRTGRGDDFIKAYGVRSIEYETFVDRKRNEKGVVTDHFAFDHACQYFEKWMKGGKWVSPNDGSTTECHPDKFDTWVIDSGTTLVEAARNKALILLGGGFGGIKTSTQANAVKHGMVLPERRDWGAERSMLEQFVNMVLSTDKHVVLLCHEYEKEDNGIVTEIEPLLTGQSREMIPLRFHEVYNLRTKKVGATTERYLQTVTDGIRVAGTRAGIPNGTPWTWDAIQAELQRIGAATQVGA